VEIHGFTVGDAAPSVSHGEAYQRLLDLVRLADHTRYDGWFFAEHHNPPMLTCVPSPNLMVAAASTITERLRMGVMVTILPYHHPVRVAEEIRMLDQLTNGRLEIGFGRGMVVSEQRAFNVHGGTTAERLEITLEVVLRLLRDGKAAYDSPWWVGEIEGLTPDPVQPPHPPMWVAAVSESSVTRAARIGASVATQLRSLESSVALRQFYQDEWAKYRPDEPVGRFAHGAMLAVGETRGDPDEYARGLLIERSERFARNVAGAQTASDVAREFVDTGFDEQIDRGYMIYGSVDEAVEQTRRIADAGIDALMVVPSVPGQDHGFTRRSVELFATDVIMRADPSRSSITRPASSVAGLQ
jgi:alkanesulfonate monooxygenase SsuD/methylene tetrahydromethanopterin reductase-like flavin-dependent oxidoreductase (luciferase family)